MQKMATFPTRVAQDSDFVNCVIRVAGRELVYHTIPVRTIAFYTGIEYSRGKIAIFPLPNDDLSEDQELLRSWSCELVQKQWAKNKKIPNSFADTAKATARC